MVDAQCLLQHYHDGEGRSGIRKIYFSQTGFEFTFTLFLNFKLTFQTCCAVHNFTPEQITDIILGEPGSEVILLISSSDAPEDADIVSTGQRDETLIRNDQGSLGFAFAKYKNLKYYFITQISPDVSSARMPFILFV